MTGRVAGGECVPFFVRASDKAMSRTIGLTYNLKTEYVFTPGDPQDANAEWDHPDTVAMIERAIQSGGHCVVRIGNATRLLETWEQLHADLVFNISEGTGGRNRESQVPIILEMLRIPYVGSDGLTLGLTLDKILTKKLLIAERIPTPRFIEIKHPDDPVDLGRVTLPAIVKPRHEGTSKGLNDASVVHNADDLRRQARWVIETYRQPALVEEFIDGSEFTVAILGNEEPEILPIVQIRIQGKLDLGGLFYTFSRVRENSDLDYVIPAAIPDTLAARIKDVALRTYQAVECRDFGRVDVRVNRQGQPYVLEINPLPSLAAADVFNLLAKHLGSNYDAMINRILDYALSRHGLTKETAPSLTASR